MDGDFGAIVAVLESDRAWRRRVRRAHLSARMARVAARTGAAAGRALGELGTCFVGAPSAAWADVPTATVRHRSSVDPHR